MHSLQLVRKREPPFEKCVQHVALAALQRQGRGVGDVVHGSHAEDVGVGGEATGRPKGRTGKKHISTRQGWYNI